jgi:diacylglycerol kinase family enzyme
VAGGDGTMTDVLNETTGIPVAMVPIGNENLFARQFGYRGPRQVARAVAAGRTRRIDLGCADDRRFGMMVSAGLDADVVRRVARWRAAPRGNGHGRQLRRVSRFSYLRPALGSIMAYEYPAITLETEDRRVTGSHVMIFNIPRYAMGLPFVPEARDDDGLLHWVVFEKPGVIALGGYLARVALRRHLRCGSVRHGCARAVRITSERPAAVQIDGDAAGSTPVDVRIAPKALDVIVP